MTKGASLVPPPKLNHLKGVCSILLTSDFLFMIIRSVIILSFLFARK